MVKQYATKTVITPYPNMSAVTASPSQQNRRSIFAEAVLYASRVKKDPVLRAAFEARIPKGVSVYRAALSEYLLLHKWYLNEGFGSGLVRSSFDFFLAKQGRVWY